MSLESVESRQQSVWDDVFGRGSRTGEPVLSAEGSEYIYALIVAALFGVFAVDLFTPLGVSEWVFYSIPIVISFVLWHPLIPPALAAIVTLLAYLGFVFSPGAGVDPSLAIQNRTFGAFTFWMLAGTGYLFIRNKLAVRRQEWLQAGQAGLALQIAGDLSVTQIGDRVLRFLTEHLRSNVATFFVEAGQHYRRSASYGVPESATVPQQVAIGDGLLGQAARVERILHVDPVPEGYLYFGSSLGQARPRQLIIAPVKTDSGVNALIELGFPAAVSPVCDEFLGRVSQTIGIAVRSARYRARLQELLEETRRQSEEVSKQSEELRAANAELEQQSRALTASQQRLELQQTELEQNNKTLED